MSGAGGLRDRLGFFRRPTARDSYGNSRGEFPADPTFEIRARVEARFSGEPVIAARLAGQETATITVRRCAATLEVDASWRIKNMRDGKIWQIKSGPVDPDGGRQWLEFLCQAGIAG